MIAPPIPGNIRVYSVSELTGEIKEALEEVFANIWVGGEIIGFKRASSGHWYLNLKDRNAVLKAVVWKGTNLRLKHDLNDGMEVICRGRLSVYPPHGQYQLSIEEVHAKGVGAQELALQQLKKKLFGKGYFDPKRKRPLPRFPRRVCVVTSPSGAAVRDMLTILNRRWPLTEVWIVPVRVQGETAAAEMTRAVERASGWTGIDVLVLARGGGGTEDLSPFNDERLADALFRSRIPVVSAVGHEIDWTIADLVADQRAATPSEAAERLVPDQQDMRKMLTERATRLRDLLQGRLQYARQQLADLAARRCFRRPQERVHNLAQQLDQAGERLNRAMRQRVQTADHALQTLAGRLHSLSPLNVLGRGYSLTRRATDLRVIRSAGDVRPGDLLVTLLQNGQLTSRVEETTPPVSRGRDSTEGNVLYS